jgi:putative transposase
LYLRNVRGFKWNQKRVCRIYKERELNLRIKPRKRLVRDKPEALTAPEGIDDFNREAIGPSFGNAI